MSGFSTRRVMLNTNIKRVESKLQWSLYDHGTPKIKGVTAAVLP